MRLLEGGAGRQKGGSKSIFAVTSCPEGTWGKAPEPLISGEHGLKIAALDPEDVYFNHEYFKEPETQSCNCLKSSELISSSSGIVVVSIDTWSVLKTDHPVK